MRFRAQIPLFETILPSTAAFVNFRKLIQPFSLVLVISSHLSEIDGRREI
jgi:hypothetical protein